MNPNSRFTARRLMFAARRKLLAILKDAVWRAHTDPWPKAEGILREISDREDRDLYAEAYYTAREMAHQAHRSQR